MDTLKIDRERLEELITVWTHPFPKPSPFKDILVASDQAISQSKKEKNWARIKALYKYPIILDSESSCRTIDKYSKNA